MKLVILLCAIAVVMPAPAKVTFPLPEESLKRMHSVGIPCAEEFGIDLSLVRKVGDPDAIPKSEATDKFLHCYGVKSGILNEDGHMNSHKLVSILGDHPLVEEAKQAVSKCNQIIKEDAVATAVAMHACYIKDFPVHYVF